MRPNNSKCFFITGTDTHVGKTTLVKILIRELTRKGFSTIGCKPIACSDEHQGINEDVLAYLELNTVNLPMSVINPIRFNLPASPNIAAKISEQQICVDTLVKQLQLLYELPIDFIFFEGVGGWKVPINEKETTIDLAVKLNVPIILVVGIRVGCLNHALLTHDALLKENVQVVGWVANVIDPNTPEISEHIATLENWLKIPLLGIIPHQNYANEDTCPIDVAQLIE